MAKKKNVSAEKTEDSAAKRRRTARRTSSTGRELPDELLMGKQNYMVIGVGLVLILTGFFLMMGGSAPNPDTWNPEEIYSFRRITLAPFVVLLGLVVIAFSIFRSSGDAPMIKPIAEEE